jgi:signal transduction histidine kinase/CheY-like chemotaxis protein
VLLVDDRPDNLVAFEATLEPLGVRIVRANSAAEALQHVHDEDFAVIVLDVQMPGMNGYEVARRIKAMAPPRLTPIIFVTALDRDRRQVHDGYESGAVDYLFKPLDPEVLRQKVAAFIRLYKEKEAEAVRERKRYADLTEAAAHRAAELHESETRYRTLFESLDEGFCIGEVVFDEKLTAVDFRWLETNPAFVRQSGLVNAVGRTARELMPGVEQSWFDRYGRVALTGESIRFQSIAEHTGRWYDVFAFRVGRPEDHQVAILFTDVTVAKEAELERDRLIRALDLERARLADVFRQAPVAVVVLRGRVAPDLIFELANPRYLDMIPQDHAPLGKRLADVIPEAGDAVYKAMQHTLDTGEPFVATDFRIPLDRDGDGVAEDYFFDFVYHPMHEADDSVSGIIGVGTDVTESVRARREAERLQHVAEAAERRLAFLAEASARLAGSLDVESTLGTIAELAVPALADWCFVEVLENGTVRQAAVTHSRPEMVRFARELISRFPIDLDAGYGTGKVLRTGEPELVPEISDETLVSVAQDDEHLRLLRSTGLRSSISVPLLDGSGRAMAVLSLVSSDSGRRYGESDLAMAMELARRAGAALSNARLVEAERAARAEAESASRTKSQFLANMSHELRTPLNAIAGHVQLIEMGIYGPVSDAQHDALVRVERAQRHLLGLINDVLNYARIEAGRVEYDVAPVLVTDVFADVLPMVESQVGAKSLTLERMLAEEEDADPVHVWADRDKLAQILLNVLSNAVKFTPEGGRITVALAEAEGPAHVMLRITDTGVGIPADKIDAVFEPFVQVRSEYTRQVEGTGLGLAISRDLARGMGGDLRVTSELGAGSTFEVVLRRVVTVGGAPVERRSRRERRTQSERRSGVERRDRGQ